MVHNAMFELTKLGDWSRMTIDKMLMYRKMIQTHTNIGSNTDINIKINTKFNTNNETYMYTRT